MELKWEDCIQLMNEDIIDHYKKTNEKCLFILGKGFDPRMCEGIDRFLKAGLELKVCALAYSEAEQSTSYDYKEYIDGNCAKLKSIAPDYLELLIDVPLSNLPLFCVKCFTQDFFRDFDRVIIDVSALPQVVSFNIIKHIYLRFRNTLHVDILVCENSIFDDEIQPSGLAQNADYMNGFNMFSMAMVSDNDLISVWIPILGKNCNIELQRVYDLVLPQEICPVLPFPSSNPKRSDEILRTVGEVLFSSFLIEKKDLLYVAEWNMLHVYQKLCTLVEYYNRTLKIIGETKFIFSISSSKLIALGALLASMQLNEWKIKNSFAVVANDGYEPKMDKYDPGNNNLYCVCLSDSVFEW